MDIFKSDAFSLRTLTDAINKRPFVPGRLGAMKLFQETGIATTTAQVEEREGVLYLVPATERGAPATVNVRAKRKLRPLQAVHLQVADRLNAEEIQDVRAFGSENQLQTIQGVVDERLDTMSQSLEATLEHLRLGAIKGIVYDADGITPLYDLFTVFDVQAEAPISFELEDSTPAPGAIRQKCADIIRRTEDLLGATPYASIHAMVGSRFMDGLVDHPECRTAWERWQDGEALRESFARRTFAYAGIKFEEYRGSVGGKKFIDDDEARFFPVGSPGLFRMHFAPANFMQTVNTMGRPMYAKAVPDPADRWVDLMAQSNPLPYCTRPKVLMQGLRAS